MHQAPVLVDIRPDKFMNKAAGIFSRSKELVTGGKVKYYKSILKGKDNAKNPTFNVGSFYDMPDYSVQRSVDALLPREAIETLLNSEKGKVLATRLGLGAAAIGGGIAKAKSLEKNAAGPPVLYKALTAHIGGKFTYPQNKGGKGVITVNTRNTPNISREVMRHELTHYTNNQKNRFSRTGEKSIRGVKDTYLNEITAYRSQRPKHLKPKNFMSRAGRAIDTLRGAAASTSDAYNGKALKTLLKLR